MSEIMKEAEVCSHCGTDERDMARLTRERDEAREGLQQIARALGMFEDHGWGYIQIATTENMVKAIQGVLTDAARLREALETLSTVERHYRDMYHRHGGQALDTVRAWDMLRKAGIEARAALAEEKPPVRTFDRHGADRGRWVGVWDAINRYSEACGGSPTAGGPSRMEAVVEVERALDAALAEEMETE